MSKVRTVKRQQLEEKIEKLFDTRSDSVVLVEGDDFLLVKQAHSVPPEERFRQLCDETQSRFEQTGVTPKDVEDAIRWARESS
jgi:hypothetical protein